MITGITVENFKGIGQRVECHFKPITMLFGANSAGKSSIIHALHYAREIFGRRNLNADQTQSGEGAIDLGGFSSFVHKHDRRRQIHLGFDLDLRSVSLPTFWGSFPPDMMIEAPESLIGKVESARVELWIGWSEMLGAAFVTKYAVSMNGLPLAEIEFQPGSPDCRMVLDARHPIFVSACANDMLMSWCPLAPNEGDDSLTAAETLLIWAVASREINMLGPPIPPFTIGLGILGQHDALPLLDRSMFLDRPLPETDRDALMANNEFVGLRSYLNDALAEVIIGPAALLRDALDQMRYLGPLRKVPPRNYQPPRFKESQQWASGMAAWDLLLESETELVGQVRTWLGDAEKLNVGYRVERKSVKELDDNQLTLIKGLVAQLSLDTDVDSIKQLLAEQFERAPWSARLVLHDLANDIDVEPQDVGVGISQLVPVVVAALDNHRGLTAIEQPELHLHPGAQVVIGDLLIAAIQSGPRVLLVETHSEHVMLRLLRRIRETTDLALPAGHPGLRPEQVAVIYVDRENGQVRATPLRIDATGEFQERWPKGFFDERAAELF